MRLHRHDELVEAMKGAILDKIDISGVYGIILATAALDALLDAAVKLEVGRDINVWDGHGRHLLAATSPIDTPRDASPRPALLLRLEERTDDT